MKDSMTDPARAPGKNARLARARGFPAFTLTHEETGESVLFQLDWDYPSLASGLGLWSPCCGATDGTVKCAEHGSEVGAMIEAAASALWDGCGDVYKCDDYWTGEYVTAKQADEMRAEGRW